MGAPFFSIGMIFKDEIRCLERCLKSLQPLRDAVPCELVMADTGSSDGSREIATKYADILFDLFIYKVRNIKMSIICWCISDKMFIFTIGLIDFI